MTEHDDDFITGDEFDPEVAAAADDKRYEATSDNEAKIVEELGAVQGSAADIGGYYLPDTAKLDKVMRPSATLNAALAKLG